MSWPAYIEELRIAVNSYRAGGGGGFDTYASAELLWSSLVLALSAFLPCCACEVS